MKLSIITVNKDNLSGLGRTIDSVVSQTSDDFEWIVIDGASTDGSRDLIASHSDKIDYWVSEPDSGIYNAMNKGIKAATGDYVLFLNSGDCLASDDVVETVNKLDLTTDFAVFDMDMSYPDGRIVRRDLSSLDSVPILHFLYKSTFPHQSTLTRRELFDTYGCYDENYKYVSDWLISLKACALTGVCKTWRYYRGITMSVYDMSGVSTVNSSGVDRERNEIINRYFTPAMIESIELGIHHGNIYNLVRNRNKFIGFMFHCILWLANKFDR